MAPFPRASWPDADLVNASFSLPFCQPSFFPVVWDRIVRSGLVVFAGQLFGDRDEWATITTNTHHTHAEAEALFQLFELSVLTKWSKMDRRLWVSRSTGTCSILLP